MLINKLSIWVVVWVSILGRAQAQEFPPLQEPWDFKEGLFADCMFGPIDSDTELEGVYFGLDGLQIIDSTGILLTDGQPPEEHYLVKWEYTVFGDLDGDGISEMVVSLHVDMRLGVLKADGQWAEGWPITVATSPFAGLQWVTALALADIDEDGDMEIVTAGYKTGLSGDPENEVYVYQEDGSVLEGWPQTVPTFVNGLAVGDLDFDGDLEIVVATTTTSGGAWLSSPVYVFEHDGSIRPGWPSTPPIPAYSSIGGFVRRPRIADLDGDGVCEIIGNSERALTVFNADGSLRVNFDNPSSEFSMGGKPVSIGDVDGDGDLDMVTSGNNALRIYDLNEGQIASLDAQEGIDHISSVSIADVDGDGDAEIGCFRLSPEFEVYLFDHNLEPLPGWPINFNGWEWTLPGQDGYRTYFIDIDGDGDLEFHYSYRPQIAVYDFPATEGTPTIHWSGRNGHFSGSAWYHEGKAEYFVRGDSNRDGQFALADIVLTLEHLFFGESVGCRQALDADDDDTLDLADGILPLMTLFGANAALPAPHPGCGRALPNHNLDCLEPLTDCP